jgi:hypothetical protein
MRWLLLFLLPLAAAADETVTICYNWGCGVEAQVVFEYPDLDRIANLFNDVETPEVERGSLRLALALMEDIASRQTPTGNDRPGNDDDDGVDGRMDCIDHSHNNTVYLGLLERRGLLKFHRVLDPVDRVPFTIYPHWAARIEQNDTEQQYIVDSWFFEVGKPPAVFTLEEWKRGAGPHE